MICGYLLEKLKKRTTIFLETTGDICYLTSKEERLLRTDVNAIENCPDVGYGIGLN